MREIYSEKIEAFLDFMRRARAEYSAALAGETEANKATQDLLHRLELSADSYHDRAKLAGALRKVRQERRESKDIAMQLEPIVKWADENERTVKGLEKLLGEVRKAEKATESRFYNEKTDIINKVLRDRGETEGTVLRMQQDRGDSSAVPTSRTGQNRPPVYNEKTDIINKVLENK